MMNPNKYPSQKEPMTEGAPSEAINDGYLAAAKDALADQSVRNGFMRNLGGAGYVMAGAMMGMEQPGVLPKVVGAALGVQGVRESIAGVKVAEGEELKLSATQRLRGRISNFAQSLVDKNTGKMNLAARLKRRTGEEMLDFKDGEYRMRFSRMMGGMAILAAGVQFADQPGVANKIIGITLGNVGLAEQLFNGQKTIERGNELRNQTPEAA